MLNSACERAQRATACVALAVMLLASGTAWGAVVPGEAVEARREVLFQQMLVQPDNLDVAFEYASLSVEAGDLEAAVSTLERMLIYAPGVPRLQLELGVLYYRLGSHETARGYFEGAMSGGNAPAEVVEKVKLYLDAIDRALRPTTLTASLYTGGRWQSNANSAPGSRTVVLNGLPFTLDDNAVGQDDFSIFAIGNVLYSLDMQSQGDRFDIEVSTFNAWYVEQTQIDTNLLEVTAGPNFNMARFGIEDTYLGIYALGNGVLLGGDGYFATAGGGVRLATKPTLQTEVFAKGEYRHRWFNDTNARPTASEREGDQFTGLLAFRYLFSSSVSGTIAGRVAREETRRDYLDNWEYGAQGQFNVLFDAPVFMPPYPWAVSLNAGYLHRDYDDPDPIINAFASQKDDEYWIGGTLNMPVHQNIAVMPQVEYRKVDSNYPTRDYDAFTAMLGLYVVY